ncbi:transporter substrate-binding domain-containing protein [Agrobacterium vitis]|nr:transporter substrate-binding domain-containing protein [Agrobacterium vitis]
MKMKMIKLAVTAVSIALASVAFGPSAHAGEVLDRILASKTLRVAAGADWGLIAHLDENNELVGYDIDVAKGIAKYLGVKAEFVTPGWDLIAAGNWAGRWDIGTGQMAPTKARADKFDFSVPYFYDRTVIVVHKDSKTTKASELNGKVVGVNGGTVAEAYANQTYTPDDPNAQPVHYDFKAGEVKTYGNSTIGFDDLRLGDGVRLDAFITDETFTEGAIKSGYPLKIIDRLFALPAAIPMMKGDKELVEKVSAAIQSMRDDGTLSKLSVKWYGSDHSVAE